MTWTHGLSDAERAAFPILCRGAALRFLLTRAYDWINTPPDAMVTRKDPLARSPIYTSAWIWAHSADNSAVPASGCLPILARA
jgi:hypothetical protein